MGEYYNKNKFTGQGGSAGSPGSSGNPGSPGNPGRGWQAPPPNPPLTLEELRGMEEDPLRRINSSLRLQASEKERLAGGDPKSRYTREAAALWEASGLLKKLEADYEPLTLEELQEMVGEPVWVQTIGYIGVRDGYYALVKGADGENIYMQSPDDPNDYGSIELYGEDWIAYRRKPEGV